MNKNRLITSIVLNSVNIVLVAICTVFALCNFKFMGIEGSLTPTNTTLFSLFTVDSNLLLLIISILILVYEVLLLIGKINKIPQFVYIFKYIGVAAVALTFATITFVFAPMFGQHFWRLYVNNNLMFHLVVPVTAIISFIFFEYDGELIFKHTFFGMIPATIYALYYIVNVLIHMNNDGTVPNDYDPYAFAQNGVGGIIFSFIGMLVFAYLLSFLIFFFAGLVSKKKRNN